MDTQKDNLDFVLRANDVCAPMALNAYADACDQHGVTDAANNARSLAASFVNYQSQNGAVLPSVPETENSGEQTTDQQTPADDTQQQPTADQPQQAHADDTQQPADNSGNTPDQPTQPETLPDQPTQQPAADNTPQPQQNGENNSPTENTGVPTGNSEFSLTDFNAEIADGKITVSKKAS